MVEMTDTEGNAGTESTCHSEGVEDTPNRTQSDPEAVEILLEFAYALNLIPESNVTKIVTNIEYISQRMIAQEFLICKKEGNRRLEEIPEPMRISSLPVDRASATCTTDEQIEQASCLIIESKSTFTYPPNTAIDSSEIRRLFLNFIKTKMLEVGGKLKSSDRRILSFEWREDETGGNPSSLQSTPQNNFGGSTIGAASGTVIAMSVAGTILVAFLIFRQRKRASQRAYVEHKAVTSGLERNEIDDEKSESEKSVSPEKEIKKPLNTMMNNSSQNISSFNTQQDIFGTVMEDVMSVDRNEIRLGRSRNQLCFERTSYDGYEIELGGTDEVSVASHSSRQSLFSVGSTTSKLSLPTMLSDHRFIESDTINI
jgi:hypothetical protein